jgi:S1-C subfamily serine protease
LLIQSRSPFAGARVANLSPAVAEELRIDSESEGVVIVDVESGSSANVLGFRPGDIVLAVNGEKISRTRDLERIAGQASRQWNITILRGGQQLNVTLRG